MTPVDRIVDILLRLGARRYGDERVSQLAHALQCATLAERDGASSNLIAASLLHDIGHLVEGGDEGLAREGIDARHEDLGQAYLSQWFDDSVTGPVKLHVDAKRFLCRHDPGYYDDLSPASKRSLELQGGIFSEDEATAFLARPYAAEAANLRRWDDLAKDPKAETPGLEHFRPCLEAHIRYD